MTDKSKFIVTILTVMIVTMIAVVWGGQRAPVTASSKITNAPIVAGPGPSQFYLQHNLISDGSVSADITHANLVNAWGLVSGPTTPWWTANNGTGTTTLYNVGTGTIVTDLQFRAPAVPKGIPPG